ncbi:hypothetical protein GOBAR_AA02769 [Gossypium barbadense]|uniref:Uncharacterized protein n=1 Tax=Gossypium barbadense TaxID=3634 RepID=A0A2P5YQD8_GOSBA|nr:hypothetical protein GOBAR_AA02769 [Gossypium barbadense]
MADSLANPSVVGANGIDEASPDLLKNTPSNIARLEDVIEHCKGRQMYLAQTRSPSDGGDVRWYFSDVPLAENGAINVHSVGLIVFQFLFGLLSNMNSQERIKLTNWKELGMLEKLVATPSLNIVCRDICLPLATRMQRTHLLQ